ncbi:MAG: isocitrate lyase/PEP mutase family protein [Sphaerochaetaceae bacterium]|nr:isocitrate lyase/PEP mutase family protein [Sphaerochaetaceae bacterium]
MSIREKRISFRELFAKEKGVIAPCVFDSASARVAYMAGFKALCLSGAELSMAMDGLPDLGILSLPELEWITSRITENCPLPLIVDAEDGFGGPQNVYRTCKRLAAAGAAAILMEDEAEPGFAKGVVMKNIIPVEEYVAKVKAAKCALEGTECIFVARTNVLIDTEEGWNDAIARCKAYKEAGADMLLVNQLKTVEQGKKFSELFPNDLKMFPDINQSVKQPTMNAKDLYPLGFNIVTMHFMMKGAMKGMLDYALKVAEDQNNLMPRDDRPYNVSGQSAQPFYPVQEWLDLEETFSGIHNTFWGDKLDLSKRG